MELLVPCSVVGNEVVVTTDAGGMTPASAVEDVIAVALDVANAALPADTVTSKDAVMLTLGLGVRLGAAVLDALLVGCKSVSVIVEVVGGPDVVLLPLSD